METMTETGTEKRVDELSKRVDFGFKQMNQRIGRVEDDVRELRAETKAGFDTVNRLMVRFFAGTLGSIIAGVIVLLAAHS
jgi:hypothetical protein